MKAKAMHVSSAKAQLTQAGCLPFFVLLHVQMHLHFLTEHI